jgi:putative toxin-antitoxin system antitoxin component (TIGR02293 family)
MILVSAERIGAVLALSPPPRSLAELEARVSRGLPKKALKASVDRIFTSAEERKRLLHRIVPEATFKRRRDRLTAAESERAERLARVYATAQHVWNSDEDARAFLTAPHAMLRGRTPLDVSLTELGARRVEEILWRLYYGLAA